MFCFVIILLFSVTLNCILMAQYQSLENSLEVIDENIFVLDEQYENEIKESKGVTSEIIEITMKYAEVWKQEMERYYDQLYDALDDEGKSRLENLQEVWEEYSTSNKDFAFYMEEKRFGGGSYLNILEADLLYQKYRSRALELSEMYQEILTEE